MFSNIFELKSIREQKYRLSERESEIAKPVLTDLGMIDTLYEWFKEIALDGKELPKGNVSQRKKFIFIILYLYSPTTLAGGKMRAGLREKLAEVFPIKEKSVVSNNTNNLVFSYQLYKYFRQDVERIYKEIILRLGKYLENKTQQLG
jgi:hypothetical protein|nr:MAG TPA: hypothetical protein [Caudoviricetes sp.]